MVDTSFSEKTINWASLSAHCRDPNWVFRGEAKSGWRLQTSLERACIAIYGSLDKAEVVEQSLLREFQRRLHHYSSHVPPFQDYLQWFSLMQHYGAPTRLLDWTYSRYIAAYFALENATEEDEACVIWAINSNWVNEQGAEILRAHSRDPQFLFKRVDEKVEYHFRQAIFRENQEAVTVAIPINPFQLNERQTIQKGVFVCPGNVKKTFEDNLRELAGSDNDQNVRKLKISVTERVKALKELY